MTISRRAFMKAGGLALVSLGADPIFLDRAAYALQSAGPLGTGKKTLVCLFQRGAVDGLSMIVPAGDPWYWQERQRIALPKEQLIPLDGMFALHPRLAPLKPLWDQHSLAIVHAVGSPSTTRSHFDAQDYMEIGHAGREEHARRLGQSLLLARRRACQHAVPRGGVRAAAAAHAGRQRTVARDRRPAHLRHARRTGERRSRS